MLMCAMVVSTGDRVAGLLALLASLHSHAPGWRVRVVLQAYSPTDEATVRRSAATADEIVSFPNRLGPSRARLIALGLWGADVWLVLDDDMTPAARAAHRALKGAWC